MQVCAISDDDHLYLAILIYAVLVAALGMHYYTTMLLFLALHAMPCIEMQCL